MTKPYINDDCENIVLLEKNYKDILIGNIVRNYPNYKDEGLYKNRYKKEVFEKYKEIIAKSIENYEKWKIGINFKTNRKIQQGGETHKRLGNENFYIRTSDNYIFFTDLDGINIELYIEETEKLKKEIQDYNFKIDEIICKINLLENYGQYIIFDGIKYGIPEIYNGIHRKNDCGGKITYSKIRTDECRECRGETSFTEPCSCRKKKVVDCIKCGYDNLSSVEREEREREREKERWKEKNKNIRSIIEEELQKIPTSEQNNLIILLTRCWRNYNSELLPEIKIIKKYEKESVLRLVNKDLDLFEQYTPCFDETWDTFDNTPFYLNCDKCDNITNKTSRGFSESTYCLFCNTEVYLEVPFCEKEEAKKLGAMWDVEFKKWYIFNGDINKELILQKWKTCQKNCVENKSLFPGRLLDKKIIETITHKVYLEVPYCEKEDAKKLGVKWDSEFKKWYIFNDNINKDLILQKWKVTIPADQMLI